MKKITSAKLIQFLGIFITLFIFSSCKKKFDVPPYYQSPNITPTMTISQLKSRHVNAGAFDAITDNPIIAGVVVADDQSGAFYKQVIIEDATGAIVLLLDAKYLYLNYPVGRQVFVNCNGLTLSDDKYNGFVTLGYVNTSAVPVASIGIPSANIPQYVTQGSLGNVVAPLKPATISVLSTSNLQDPYLGALIQLDNIEFSPADTSKTWGDITPPSPKYVNLTVSNCNGEKITCNTSSFANFANYKVPFGNGSLLGIYSVAKGARQLLVRDSSDAPLHHVRCNGSLFPPNIIYDATSVFAGIVTKTQINLTGWLNIAENGGVYYQGFVGATGSLASITAYKAGTPPVTSWLISPAIKIPSGTATPPYLSFSCIDGYDNGASFGVYVSINYNGNNTPSQSPNTWTKLNYTAPSGAAKYSPLTPSGNIDLSNFAGKTIYIGFKYDGTATQNTTFEFNAPMVAY